MSKSLQTNSIVRRFIIFGFIFVFVFTFTGLLQIVCGQTRQLSLADILIALRSKKAEIAEKNRLLAEAVKDRGITFTLTPEIEKELENTGAYRDLLDAIRSKTTPPRETVAVSRLEPPKTDIPSPKPTAAPLDFSYYRNRATDNLASGDMDLAIADLNKAIELKPGDAKSYLDRGLSLVKQNKIDLALKDLDKAIELDQKNSVAYFNRALISEKLGQIDKAISDFDKASELDTANDQAKTSAARLREVQAQAANKPDPPTSQPAPEPETKNVSVGALNGYASNLSIPVYPQIDKQRGIQGRVTVQITLDETGKVVTAVASEGPQSLRWAAEAAIRRSKFRPIIIDEKSVKASGYITYNFVANQ